MACIRSSNNQSGPVGLGWSLTVGSITEHFESCGTYAITAGAPQDVEYEVCPNLDDGTTAERYFSISLNGRSSRLIYDSTEEFYRLQSDPYWRVELETNGSVPNRDSGDEYWVVTTPDGTQYRFGWNADAADYRPVYYPAGTGWPSAPCAASNRLCDEVFRWNLDEVSDVHGNEIHYLWRQELNYYNARQSASFKTDYVMASGPAEITYTEGTQSPNARVLFKLGGALPAHRRPLRGV